MPWMTWFWFGHSTFLSSAQHSPMKPNGERRLRYLAGRARVVGRDTAGIGLACHG